LAATVSLPSFAAESDLAKKLAGKNVCFSDGSRTSFGEIYTASGTTFSGKPVSGHGPWTVNGNRVTIRFQGARAHNAYRVDEVTIGSDGTVHEVTIEGRHPNGETYAGDQYDGHFCS
jgi:hypothetical protein